MPTPIPSMSPTVTIIPTVAPTPRPTPAVPFPYEAEGDGAFGFRWRNDYDQAHLMSVKRPGWSWYEPGSGYSPFCFRDTCYNITNPCMELGGTLLHDYVCSFPDNVKIMGPSCWQGDCVANGESVCSRVNGITVGQPDGSAGPQWCLFTGDRSFVGPMCYGSECYPSETIEACNQVEGGRVWNRDYCVMDGYWTPVGPICWQGLCIFGEAETKCARLGGNLFAKRWCIIRGCDWTVIGPTCTRALTGSLNEQCFVERTREVCVELGGTQIGERYCVLPGTDWTFIGPTGFATSENIGATSDFCRELKSNLNGFFNFMQSWDIAGRFCLIKDRLPTTTPFCLDGNCFPQEGRAFCNRFEGKQLANGFMCTLSPYFRQVVGPLRYGEVAFEGNPEFCEGSFCAIPDDVAGSQDPRCPIGATEFTRGCKDRRNGCIPTGLNCSINCEEGDDDDDGSGGDDDDDGGGGGSSSAQRTRSYTGFVVVSLLLLSQTIFYV